MFGKRQRTINNKFLVEVGAFLFQLFRMAALFWELQFINDGYKNNVSSITAFNKMDLEVAVIGFGGFLVVRVAVTENDCQNWKRERHYSIKWKELWNLNINKGASQKKIKKKVWKSVHKIVLRFILIFFGEINKVNVVTVQSIRQKVEKSVSLSCNWLS